MSFDAGALIFKIQTLGKAEFARDQAESKAAFDKTGDAANTAATKVDKAGTATEATGKKAKAAKGSLDDQAKATADVGNKSDDAGNKQRKQAASTEEQIASAKKLSAALMVAGVAVAAMVSLSVAKWTEFDSQMSNTSAAIMATADEHRELADVALEAGADTAYSATEAAAAEEELAKAGQSVAAIVGGSLSGALALAAAGQLQVARSAEIMATTLTQFRLPAEQAAHVSDVLAAGAGKAQGSVDDLALALSYVGPIAGSVGFSLNETAGTIAYLATQGIVGEKAGTSLRGVLASLQAPSALAAKEMEKYSLNMFDANGNMLSLSGIAEQLHTKLGGLTEQERLAALGRIFGNESLNAATLLYEGGAKTIEKWTDAVDDTGYAALQAAKRQDNLAGDLEKLGGAFDTALIKTGSGANDVLRTMVQALTELIDFYGELPAPIQTTALVLGVATAAILLFAGGAVGAKAKFLELKAAMDVANVSMGRTALLGGAAGLALTGIVTVVALLAANQAAAEQKAKSYADTLEAGSHKITKATREMAKEALAADEVVLGIFNHGSAYDAADQLGISMDLVTDAATGQVEALKELQAQLDAGAKGHNGLAKGGLEYANAATVIMNAVSGEAGSIERAIEIAKQKQQADQESAATSQTAAEAYVATADEVKDLNTELQDLIDTINEANGVGQDAVSKNIDYQNSLAKVDEYIRQAQEGQEGYALTLDQSTQAGRDNLGMLNEMAADAQAAADAQFALDGNTDSYRATLEAGRQALIDRAQQLGYNADQAAALADQIYRIPSETEWKMIADTSQAAWTIQDFMNRYGRLSGTVIYRSNLSDLNGQVSGSGRYGTFADGGNVRFFAGGGSSEQHVAQFARAGDWRIWAEPETGGEWYIPDSPQKRSRSLALTEQMVNGWGYTLVPAGASQMASGGGAGADTSAASRHGGPLVSFDGAQFYSYDPRDVDRKLNESLRRTLDAYGM